MEGPRQVSKKPWRGPTSKGSSPDYCRKPGSPIVEDVQAKRFRWWQRRVGIPYSGEVCDMRRYSEAGASRSATRALLRGRGRSLQDHAPRLAKVCFMPALPASLSKHDRQKDVRGVQHHRAPRCPSNSTVNAMVAANRAAEPSMLWPQPCPWPPVTTSFGSGDACHLGKSG